MKRKRIPILCEMEGYPITEAIWKLESSFSDDSNMFQQYKYQL